MNHHARFTMLDESFICQVCGKQVNPLNYTARNHCPYCLCSLHVDLFPGDRSCLCHGILQPIGIEKAKKGFKIIYKCKICQQVKKNVVAQDDNMDLIIQLSANPLI